MAFSLKGNLFLLFNRVSNHAANESASDSAPTLICFWLFSCCRNGGCTCTSSTARTNLNRSTSCRSTSTPTLRWGYPITLRLLAAFSVVILRWWSAQKKRDPLSLIRTWSSDWATGCRSQTSWSNRSSALWSTSCCWRWVECRGGDATRGKSGSSWAYFFLVFCLPDTFLSFGRIFLKSPKRLRWTPQSLRWHLSHLFRPMTVCKCWHDRCLSHVALQKAIEVMCVVPKRCNDMMNVGRLQGFEVRVTHTSGCLPLGVSVWQLWTQCHTHSAGG